MPREPRARRRANAARLLGVHHLERVAEAVAALLLHLDDHDPPPAPDDEVELVPAHARVGVEQAIATEPVMKQRAALAAIHAASDPVA